MSAHSIVCKIKEISLNYPYIVFGGNPCGLKNAFDSSMVKEPSGFEPLKFYCNRNINGQSKCMLCYETKAKPVLLISFKCAIFHAVLGEIVYKINNLRQQDKPRQ